MSNIGSHNEMMEIEKNKIFYMYKKIKVNTGWILNILTRYVLNIMKKIEFELIRNEGVYVKVTDEQKYVIKKLAKFQKKGTSDFIKWVIFSKYIDDFIK
ncbi:MAG: hypothetical protein E7207_01370 [Clostridium butyricum]|nr:hypothetical protein [Clostridium butyricum]